MIFNHIKNNRFNWLTFLLLVGMFAACGDDSNDAGSSASQGTVTWKTTSTVSAEKGNATLLLEGQEGTTWKAEVVAGAEWCAFVYNFSGDAADTTGVLKEGINALYVYYRTNQATSKRVARIQITFPGAEPKELVLTQLGVGEVAKPNFGIWAETPKVVETSKYEYVTHYTKLKSGQKVRNYSYCYDPKLKTALWVAYPLHDAYLGGVKRTDAWDYDPYVAEENQARIYKGFRSTTSDRYDRGHQLPSADRLNTVEMNEQTFYFTNMTPQMSRLNQDMWAKLEGKVRDNRCSDTLYVVTGAHFANTNKNALDNNGEKIPVPTHYYKVFLRTKSGKSGKNVYDCKATELKAIGVWVEHKNYGDVYPPKAIFTSVADIEKKTGITFFPNIPESVKQDFNYTDWNF